LTQSEEFPNQVSEYLGEKINECDLQNLSIFLCRNDGVIIFSQSGLSSSLDESAIGALIAGVWQAAGALTSFIPSAGIEDFFRLSFDTSSRGVYVLPVKAIDGREYYFGSIYYDAVNPGLLKSKFRSLRDDLEGFVSTLTICGDKEDKSTFLFDNITDNAMDQLFSFAGKK
jgi:hypothetical protein